MNRFLLDTHALIWYLEGNKRMPNRVVEQIENVENAINFSIASYWEIYIKVGLGKIKLPVAPSVLIQKAETMQISTLPINYLHLEQLLSLPAYHKDPFDRLIISTALSEKIPVVTIDEQFQAYDVTVLWD